MEIVNFAQNNSSFKWEERASFCPFNVLGPNTRCYTSRPAPEAQCLAWRNTYCVLLYPAIRILNKETGGSNS